MRIVSDPYSQGLDRQVAVRLVTLSRHKAPDLKDRKKYERTPHFQKLREAVVEKYETCCLCGNPGTVVHHRPSGYKNLFNEDLEKDVTLLDARCHRRTHRK